MARELQQAAALPGRRRVAAAMTDAAVAFLESLTPEQRSLAAWPFPSETERRRWFYTPTDHGGLPLSGMRPSQQQLALRLLATGLSRAAYVTAATIVGLENVLDELEGWSLRWGRERGRDPGLYYVRVFGDPAADAGRAWSWRFGGHHVSVHHLVVEGAVAASTPLFLGADPASSPLLGGELRPLGPTEDLARELVTSLDPAERERAVISPVPPFDLVTANRPAVTGGERPLPLHAVWRSEFEGELRELVEAIQRRLETGLAITEEHVEAVRLAAPPRGVPASELRGGQRKLLRELLGAYLGRLPEPLVADELERYEGERIGELSFAWAGAVERGRPHYYRLQGPRLLVEYDNAQRDGNHAHSVLRDPVRDFGADLLGEHRAGRR